MSIIHADTRMKREEVEETSKLKTLLKSSTFLAYPLEMVDLGKKAEIEISK